MSSDKTQSGPLMLSAWGHQLSANTARPAGRRVPGRPTRHAARPDLLLSGVVSQSGSRQRRLRELVGRVPAG
ncbi:hypothetical protein [Streptomyces hokutonensis]|uniref:hypothetical protein n=1 Tax=Streptomyces hokutonensis TaxID=1306990 RepID=UPI00382A7C13